MATDQQGGMSVIQCRQNLTEHRQPGSRVTRLLECKWVELRRLAKPAGCVAVGSVVAYLVVLIVLYLVAPGLVASTVIAGTVVALGIGFVGGAALYVREARSPSAPVMDRSDDDVRASTE